MNSRGYSPRGGEATLLPLTLASSTSLTSNGQPRRPRYLSPVLPLWFSLYRQAKPGHNRVVGVTSTWPGVKNSGSSSGKDTTHVVRPEEISDRFLISPSANGFFHRLD